MCGRYPPPSDNDFEPPVVVVTQLAYLDTQFAYLDTQ